MQASFFKCRWNETSHCACVCDNLSAQALCEHHNSSPKRYQAWRACEERDFTAAPASILIPRPSSTAAESGLGHNTKRITVGNEGKVHGLQDLVQVGGGHRKAVHRPPIPSTTFATELVGRPLKSVSREKTWVRFRPNRRVQDHWIAIFAASTAKN